MVPIEKLPFELLQIILLYFCPQSHDKDEKQRVRELGYVCRWWRQIIIDTPKFWTFIDLYLPSSTVQEDVQPRLQVLLGRSGSLLVDVVWIMKGTSQQRISDLLSYMNDKPSSNHWRSLTVENTKEMYTIRSIFDKQNVNARWNFGRLEELTIDGILPGSLTKAIQESAHNLNRLVLAPWSSYTIHRDFHYVQLMARVDQVAFQTIDFRLLKKIPPKITHLELASAYSSTHRIYPHITHLVCKTLNLVEFMSNTFPGLVYLRASFESATQVVFAKLQHLVVEVGLWDLWHLVSDSANSVDCIAAPKLQILHLARRRLFSHRAVNFLDRSIRNTRYQLSPTTLIIDTNISPDTIALLISKSSQLLHLELKIHSPQADCSPHREDSEPNLRLKYALLPGPHHIAPSWDVLVDALIAREDKVGNGWVNCPELLTLQISLRWAQLEKDLWPEYAMRIAQGRAGGDMRSIELNWTCGTKVIIDVGESIRERNRGYL